MNQLFRLYSGVLFAVLAAAGCLICLFQAVEAGGRSSASLAWTIAAIACMAATGAVVALLRNNRAFRKGLRYYARRLVSLRSELREARLAPPDEELCFSAAFEHAAVGACLIGLEGQWLYVNPALCQLLGYSREDLLAKSFFDIVIPEDLESELAQMRKLLKAESSHYSLDRRCLKADGSAVWTSRIVSISRDACGKPACFHGIIQDNSVPRNLEQEARHKAEQFERLMDILPVAVWLVEDPRGLKISCNQTAFDLMGAPADRSGAAGAIEAMRATSVEFLRDGKELSPEELPWQQAVRTGEPTGELEFSIQLPDRTVRHMLGAAVPLFDDEGFVRGSIGAFKDISAHKRAEESVEFIAQSGVNLAVLDDAQSVAQKVASSAVPFLADFCLVDAVDHAGKLKLEGIAHAELSGERILRDLAVSRPALDAGALLAAGENEQGVLIDREDQVLGMLGAPGLHDLLRRKLAPHCCIKVPVSRRGTLLGVISLFACGSRPPYTDGDLSLAWDLAWRAAVALENSSLYRRAREAELQKDEFVTALAHELRNPLADMNARVHFLDTPAGQRTAGQVSGFLKLDIARLSRLTNELLDVSRLATGRVAVRKEQVCVSTVCRQALDSAREVLNSRRHQVSAEIDDPRLVVNGDALWLEQMLIGLLDNAARYTPEGGEVGISARAESGDAVITVRDSGCGIPPGMETDIFSRFKPGAVDKSARGLGLCLKHAAMVAELHGGMISASSEGAGCGSTFKVRIPLAPAEDCARMQSEDAVGLEGETLQVLLVDDNEDVGLMTSFMLRDHGHKVEVVHDGTTAMRALARGLHDVVLLDIGMPGMDGYDVARRLRDEGYCDSLFVAVTAYGQDRDRERSEEAGFDYHLVKPLDYSALLPLLGAWRQSSRARALREKREKARPAALNAECPDQANVPGACRLDWGDC